MEEYQLTNNQLEIINGALLGDGTISKPCEGHPNSVFVYSSKIKEHVVFVTTPLYNLTSEKGQLSFLEVYDKRTEKVYNRYTFRTLTNTIFTKIRNKWYPEGKKIIPSDLKLTPLICLIWYLGDGYLSSNGNKTSQELIFSTDCFTKEDLEAILLPQLREFEAHIRGKQNKFHIVIPHRKIKNFLNYIGSCPVEEYKYKWNFRDYKHKGFENKEEKIEKAIIAYNYGANMNEISKYLGVSSQTIRSWLIKNNINTKINAFSHIKIEDEWFNKEKINQ